MADMEVRDKTLYSDGVQPSAHQDGCPDVLAMYRLFQKYRLDLPLTAKPNYSSPLSLEVGACEQRILLTPELLFYCIHVVTHVHTWIMDGDKFLSRADVRSISFDVFKSLLRVEWPWSRKNLRLHTFFIHVYSVQAFFASGDSRPFSGDSAEKKRYIFTQMWVYIRDKKYEIAHGNPTVTISRSCTTKKSCTLTIIHGLVTV